MAWKIMIDGVDRTQNIRQKDGVNISLERNERGTASFTCNHGYMPDLRDEVLIYDTDGVTLLFGGIVFNRETNGIGQLLLTKVECVDWSVYTAWRTVSHTFTGVVSLKDVLQFLVNNYLDDYGITLAAGQVTGPSVDATNYTWTYKTIDGALRDVTTYLGGYTWSIDPSKVLEMVLYSSAPAAPFTITDANSNVESIDWSESSEEYATRVVLLCGGTGTAEIQQTWTITPTDLANGYLETDVPSTPTGGVSLTVNGTPKSIGGSGSELIWDWVTHRITAGTFVPIVGDVFVLTYTAQYPFAVVEDAGITPPIEVVIDMPDVLTKASGTAMAQGLLARYYQNPKHFEIETSRAGLRPGQQLTINLTGRSTGSVVALITSVSIRLVSDGFWRHSVKASTGVFQTSPLDYFRSLSGAAPVASFAVGINPGAVASITSGLFLGGSRNQSVSPDPAAYTPVPDYVLYVAPTSFTATVRVDLWARNAGIGCTARLRNVTAGTTAGTSSTVTSTSATSVTFTATIVGGQTYRLEILASANGEPVYGIGSMESV